MSGTEHAAAMDETIVAYKIVVINSERNRIFNILSAIKTR